MWFLYKFWLRKNKALEGYIKIHNVHIPAYSRIFRHIYAYSGVTQAYSEPCVALAYSELWYIQNPGISKTLHIQNQRHIQNPEIFRTRSILRTLSNIYDGALWETANGYNYFLKLQLFWQYQLFMSSSSWNKYDFF